MLIKDNEALVSVIMPTYNCGSYIAFTLESVLSQTYKNFEVIIVDDKSTDNTEEIIKPFILEDSRIKYIKLSKNSGAAIARNTAIDCAQGRYLAFLDSDDLWTPDKLEKQISFMEENEYNFSCTSYNKVDEQGKDMGVIINAIRLSDYKKLLKKNAGNSTIIYNCEKIGKIKIPNIKKRNDYLMWLQVIKRAKMLHGLQEVLASHRIRSDSISSNKFTLIEYHWIVYRKYEKLSFFYSMYLVMYWCFVTLLKRFKTRF